MSRVSAISNSRNRHAVTTSFVLLLIMAAIALPATAQTVATTTTATVDTLVSVGENSLFFRIIPGGQLTVLMEAGGGMDSTEWDELAPRIARETGATVVCYDRAGFGQSELPEAPHDMKLEASWLWRALGHLELDRNLVLVGHSFGGWMIRLEASEYPDDIRGLVFVDPFSAEFVNLMGVPYLDDHPFTGKLPFDASQPDKLTPYERATLRMVGDGLGPKLNIMAKTRVPAGIPVVIIKSGLDTWPKPEEQAAWSQALDQMAASIDGATVMVAEQSNHMINFQEPDIIFEAVKETVARARG